MTVVVDASVVLKWVIEEDGSEAAEALLLNDPLLASDFLIVECANVLWVKARRGRCVANLQARPYNSNPGGANGVGTRRGLHRCRPGDRF
jgi:predicted nucleic acid-binding protein